MLSWPLAHVHMNMYSILTQPYATMQLDAHARENPPYACIAMPQGLVSMWTHVR